MNTYMQLLYLVLNCSLTAHSELEEWGNRRLRSRSHIKEITGKVKILMIKNKKESKRVGRYKRHFKASASSYHGN